MHFFFNFQRPYFFKKIFIWLNWVLVAAHGIFDLCGVVATCELLMVACGIEFPNWGLNLGSLSWEPEI